ncbi:MAG TPA: branched-chain amino acid aminotransferase [Steroidobacteraceae bacterium]|nr:branched-chain amino acid aminotransferase [Steroidobacteraceae bacterium]
MTSTTPQNAPFGSILTDVMAIAWFHRGEWRPHTLKAVGPIEIHPAAHALHYGSECFEGFKAYKWADGSVHVFRMDRHIERLRQSARALVLPEPDAGQVAQMVTEVIDRCRSAVPDAPGALYLRPLLFGTMANIGAASTPTDEACLVVLASPVWDYFAGGARPLRIYLEEHATRCASRLGVVKTGGNYAAALGPTLAARAQHKADQVLFCPGGEVQETGAANFLAIRDGEILTRGLDSTFLHGVTRDSLLRMAPDLGFKVDERIFTIAELLAWVTTGEAALSGTAAVLSGVGTLIRGREEFRVGSGAIGPNTQTLRAALLAIQHGTAPDRHGWLTRV